MPHPYFFQIASREYDILFDVVKSKPDQQKLEFAITNKNALLGMTSKIPALLAIFSDEEQLSFLTSTGEGVTEFNLSAILKNVRLAANKATVATANEANITEHNLVSVTEELVPDAKDRLNFILARIMNVTSYNFHAVANILPKDVQEQFINSHIDRLERKNIIDILSLISPSNQLKFLSEQSSLIVEGIIAWLTEKLSPENRGAFIRANEDKVNSSNFIFITSMLTEEDRMPFATRHAKYVNSKNLVALLKLGLTDDTRTIWIVFFEKCIDATNFLGVLGLTPQESQLELLEHNHFRFLEGKSRAVWGEHLAKLSNANDRVTFFQAHQAQLYNAKEDIFTVAWIMEQLPTQHALQLAKDNLSYVQESNQILAILKCKTLDFAARLALIEAYKPFMLKQPNQAKQTFEIRKYFAGELKQITGKDYPRGDKQTDLQALNILINIAKQHLGINTSNHNPRVFGAANSSLPLAMETDETPKSTLGNSRASA
jgi:hypothetical protein